MDVYVFIVIAFYAIFATELFVALGLVNLVVWLRSFNNPWKEVTETELLIQHTISLLLGLIFGLLTVGWLASWTNNLPFALDACLVISFVSAIATWIYALRKKIY